MNHVCYAVLSECFSFVSCLSYVSLEMSCVRFYPNVLRSFCACHTFLSECLAFGSRLLFAACAPNRTACGMFRSCSAVGRDRHSCVLGCRAVIGLGWFTSGLYVSLWRSRRRTKEMRKRAERRDAENGVGGEAEERFCVTALALLCFPRGVRWGCAPQTAPKSHWLSGLSSFGS